MRQSNKIGKSLEKRIAKKIGGKVTIGSGNLWFDKEDVKNSEWLFQTKATDKDYYILKLIDIQKLISSANKTIRKWAFAVEFNSGHDLDRLCFIGVPIQLIDSLLDPELARDFIITNKKQVKLKRIEMEEAWLEDEFVFIEFAKEKIGIVFINELDFLKLFKETLK